MKTFYRKLKPSSKPLRLQIYETFIDAIKDGSLGAGDQIPSTRELAKLYKCHRLTVMNSMQSLIAEGWLESSERSHYFVSHKIPVISSKASARNPASKNVFPVVRPSPTDDAEDKRAKLEFWGGQPDLRLFPMNEFRSVVADSLKRVKPEVFSYGHARGLPSLRLQVADYLRRTRSLVDKELLITNGSQEALYLIAQTFLKPGDRVAIEAKGYPPAWAIFKSLGAVLVPIEVDGEGLITTQLKAAQQQAPIKMIYTTPLHHYPTTVTLSPRRRQELLEIAERHRIPILEDDYDHEFHYAGPPPAPLSSESEWGIYISSFSKVLFPGARLGVIACNAELIKHLVYQKHLVSRQNDCLSQLALQFWIKDGGFERHLRRMRRAYEKRFDCLLEHLQKLKSRHNIQWSVPSGGMSIWVDLQRDSQKIANKALAQDVLFQFESSMDCLSRRGTHLRIGFAGVNEREIKIGMDLLDNLL